MNSTVSILSKLLPFALVFLSVSAVSAHHGFTGAYDFDHPIVLSGRVTRVRYGNPHAEVWIDIGRSPRLPRDLTPLEPLERLEGRATISLLEVPEEGGIHRVLLPPFMTRDATRSDHRPEPGDEALVVAYLRVSDDRQGGELRAIAFFLTDGTLLTAPRRSYHRGTLGFEDD